MRAIGLGARGPYIYPIIPYNISFQKGIVKAVQFTFRGGRKTKEG